MSIQDKMNQMLIDLEETLDNDELEDALVILSMIKNAERLNDWFSN